MLRSSLIAPSVVALALASSAYAQTPSAPLPASAPTASQVDPWEKGNRVLFLAGGAVDIVVIRPVSIFYKRVTPRPARQGVHNVVVNLGEPVNFANRVLQLRPKEAASSFARFALNSTAGVGGIFDVASGAGLPEKGTNFGQTLGRYGAPAGPYIFLPILGPSSVRDATGRVADLFLDPINWLKFRDDTYFFTARTVVTGLDERVVADPALRAIQKTATDPYAAIRSAYLQNSEFLVNGGKLDVKALPDFGPEPTPSPSTPQPTPRGSE